MLINGIQMSTMLWRHRMILRVDAVLMEILRECLSSRVGRRERVFCGVRCRGSCRISH